MSNESKKTTLGWSIQQTEIDSWTPEQQRYVQLLKQNMERSKPRAIPADQMQVQVHQDYAQQAQVQHYDADPYSALKAELEAQQAPRTNRNVQPRAARGSQQPLPSDTLSSVLPPHTDFQPTHPYAVMPEPIAQPIAGPHVAEYVQQQQTYAQQQQQHVATQAQYMQQLGYAPTQAQQSYEEVQQAQIVSEYAQHNAGYAQYYAQQQAYVEQQKQAEAWNAQQAAAQPNADVYAWHAQGHAAQQAQMQNYPQYADAQGYAQQGYAQQGQQYAQSGFAQDPHTQGYAQQAYAQGYAGQYPAADYGQQPQQADHQPQQDTGLGGMAAKLKKRAEKHKAKLEAALKQDSKKSSKDERPIAGADATVGQSARRRFIKRTYKHLFMAILAFSGLLWTFMNVELFHTESYDGLLDPFIKFALGGRWNWGVVLAAYMGASFIADKWASNAKSRAVQYMGLGFYVLAEAVIFVPLLAVVEWKTHDIIANGGGDPNIVRDAAFLTLGTFGMLTLSVLVSKKDFSFLRSGLFAASGIALTLIVLSLTFGFNLGLVFSVGMVVLAAGYILYQTSQVLAHYDPESHVAASLALFSSLALMFWYIIRILMKARD